METQENLFQKLLIAKKMTFIAPISVIVGFVTGQILKNFPLWIVLITMGIIVVIVTRILSRIVENKFYQKRYEEKINKIKGFFDYIDKSLYRFDPKIVFETESLGNKVQKGKKYYSYTLFEALEEIERLGNTGKLEFKKTEEINTSDNVLYDFDVFTRMNKYYDDTYYNIRIKKYSSGLGLEIWR